jgi:hypothetical protein
MARERADPEAEHAHCDHRFGQVAACEREE